MGWPKPEKSWPPSALPPQDSRGPSWGECAVGALLGLAVVAAFAVALCGSMGP